MVKEFNIKPIKTKKIPIEIELIKKDKTKIKIKATKIIAEKED